MAWSSFGMCLRQSSYFLHCLYHPLSLSTGNMQHTFDMPINVGLYFGLLWFCAAC